MKILPLIMVLGLVSHTATAQGLYYQDFETNNAGWTNAVRVPSGTNGVPSQGGNFHATVAQNSGAFTQWGGYNFGAGTAVPTTFQAYTTSIGIYLNPNGGFANDTRFDFSSAINNAGGTHLRDFVFNGGFYNSTDMNGPGAGINRFVFSVGNNAGRANSFPMNAGAIAIAAAGWYTFEHHFYNNNGFLNVDFRIFDSTHTLLQQWTLAADAIAGVGGNRYGWFVNNEFSSLAIDNARLTLAPLPETGATFGLLLLGVLVLVGLKLRLGGSRA